MVKNDFRGVFFEPSLTKGIKNYVLNPFQIIVRLTFLTPSLTTRLI
jgi:hypothetical protein